MRIAMTGHDVAIYTASSSSAGLYDRTRQRAGGAERQMTLLARTLADAGKRVAHIVYPPREPVSLPSSRLTLVHRAEYAGGRRFLGPLLEAVRIWQSLDAADARVAIIRAGTPAIGVAALFSKLRRRGLIFSSANNAEFDAKTKPGGSHKRLLYRVGVRLADAVVVQSEDQLALAQKAFPGMRRRIVHIPSFAEIPPLNSGPAATSDALLWVGRLADDKRPMHYVDLARALPDARFLMIAVPQEHGAARLAQLRSAVRDLPNLDLLEPVPHAELMELISQSVAVVNTAVSEGMPNIFLEAWARGVPALTLEFDPDGVVAKRRLGIAAEGSWERFVAGARELWLARGDHAELAHRARAYLAEVHAPEIVAARWCALVERVDRARPDDRRSSVGTPTEGRRSPSETSVRPGKDRRASLDPGRAKHPSLRLVVYLDGLFRAVNTPGGPIVAAHPVDYTFVGVFLAEVRHHFEQTLVLGRLDETSRLDDFVPLPKELELVPLPYYPSLTKLGAVVRAAWRTRAAFQAALDDADVVWIFGPHPFGLMLAAQALIRRKPFVLGIRQDTAAYFRARLPSPLWRPVLLPLRMVDAAFRVLGRRFHVIAAGTDIADRYGGQGERVLVVTDSVFSENDLAKGVRRRDWSGSIELLTVSRIDAEKNPMIFVDMLARLGDRYRLTFVGGGPLEEELIRRAEALGVVERLQLRGWIPFGGELLDMYRKAHIFVHVSLTEGVPRVLFEALACGTPVVATEVGGVRSALDHGRAGLLVPPRDAAALAGAVEWIVTDAQLRDRLMSHGLELARAVTREAQAAHAAEFIAGAAEASR
jgi:glycosyltransferase involved in cell wall biosynthesis